MVASHLRHLLEALGEKYIDDAPWTDKALASALTDAALHCNSEVTCEACAAWLNMHPEYQDQFVHGLRDLLTMPTSPHTDDLYDAGPWE